MLTPLLVAERPEGDIEKPFRLHSEFAPAGDQSEGIDGFILTETRTPQASFDGLSALAAQRGFLPGSVAAPRLLGISHVPIAADEERASSFSGMPSHPRQAARAEKSVEPS